MQIAKFLATCVLWYLSSAITNNIGKKVLEIFKFPVTLTMVQFGFLAVFSYIYGTHVSKTLKPVTKQILSLTFPLSLFQIAGHIFSSIALTFVTVSFSHTIKALSPLFTVLIYRLFFGIIHSNKVYSSLIVLTSGVMLAVATNFRFHITGFSCALLSTIIFVIQNIFSKRLFSQSKLHIRNSVSIDKLSLLFYSGIMAFLLMLPIWYQSEGKAVMTSLIENPPSWNLLYLLLLNGITHFSQAVLAFSVLSLVSPITYSIASLCKRIFVIAASIVYFGDSVNLIQVAGIALTFFGLYLYHLAENDVERGENEILNQQRRSSLPISRRKS